MSAAGVHDDAGAFPCLDKPFAGIRAVELQNQIIHVGDLFQQIGGVGVHFFQERAAVHNLAARQIHHAGKGVDGVGQGGDAGARLRGSRLVIRHRPHQRQIVRAPSLFASPPRLE